MDENHQEPHLPPPKARIPFRAWFLGLVILLCGMIAGSSLTFWFMTHGFFREFGPPGKHMPEHITHKLQHELDLDEAQTQAVLDIFTKSHERMEALRHKAEPEIEAEMESVRVAVGGLLNPEQLEKWNKRVEDMRRHRPHFPGDRPVPPNPESK